MVKKKAVKISKVKRNNQKRTKLSKQGKLKTRRNKKAEPKSQPKPVKHGEADEDQSDHGEDMLDMVEGDDLLYLKQAISQRSYQLLRKIRAPGGDQERGPRKRRKGGNSEDTDDIEQLYENESGIQDSGPKRTRVMLPIKTSKGLVTRVIEEDVDYEAEAQKKKKLEEMTVMEKDAESEKESEDETESIHSAPHHLNTEKPITTAQLLACRQEVLQQRKFRIGILCSGLLENPEGRMKSFKPLLDFMEEPNPEVKITVRKLATVSLLEVFKDLLPSYYIKVLDVENVILKKATLQLRRFEQDLLKNYKLYLTKLEKLASCLMRRKGDTRKFSQQEVQLGEVAVQCMADLLVTHPYFNYSVNLSQYLVTFLDNHSPTVRDISKVAIKKLFKDDKRGEISLEIVRRINGLVKKREHNVHADVLEVLLYLRIKDVNLDKEKEDELQQKKFKGRKMKLLSMSKKERKRDKKLKELEGELQETKAEENKQKKQQHLTEVVKVVFMIYFRIFKQEPNTKLLSVTLEGLAKFSHCINLEYYHDLVNVLDDLMETGELGNREQLHIVQTVFTILSGQGEMLTIDPCRFYTHLYRNLLNVHAGKSHQDGLILVRAIDVMLIKRRKKVSQQRILAFTKRLATLALQLLHNGSLSCLGHIKSVLQLNKSSDILLDVDKSGGQGLYDPFLEEPEYCNAGNTALWEMALLHRHYHPLVRKFTNFISSGAPATGVGSLSLDLAKLTAEDLFTQYDGSTMAFKPAIPPPKKVEPKQKPARSYISNTSLNEQVKRVMESGPTTGNFFKAFEDRN